MNPAAAPAHARKLSRAQLQFLRFCLVGASGFAVNLAVYAVLLALGVHREQAINFSLASGMLLWTTAGAAALAGVATSLALGRMFPSARRGEARMVA